MISGGTTRAELNRTETWPPKPWVMRFPKWRKNGRFGLSYGRPTERPRPEGLAQRQGDLAEETERASPGQGESLKNLQDELNEELKDFLEQMDQTARSLGILTRTRWKISWKSSRIPRRRT